MRLAEADKGLEAMRSALLCIKAEDREEKGRIISIHPRESRTPLSAGKAG
jgi:hypothetical protein